MPSFQISLTPSKRAAGRFVANVRRAIQKALAEEQRDSGITQSELARRIGVHRSVIHRQIQGREDMTLSRVAELAWALGRKPVFELPKVMVKEGSNLPPPIHNKSPNAGAERPPTGSSGPKIEDIINALRRSSPPPTVKP
jgi:hypothetical protein